VDRVSHHRRNHARDHRSELKILALDLSSTRGTIALCESGDPPADAAAEDGQAKRLPYSVVAQHDWPNDRRASAPFFSVLDEVVRKYGPPKLIVVGLGPGSYTGTRIALAAAIGLQTTAGAQLCGLSSAVAISLDNEYAVIGEAKRSSFFFAQVRDGLLVGEPQLLAETELNATIARSAVPVYTSDELPNIPRAQIRFPSAELLCARALRAPDKVIRAPLKPIYLRPPHITSPRAAVPT
jgi:tRNA threonylcarbamoyladenosine biosynthesis protein TsaB